MDSITVKAVYGDAAEPTIANWAGVATLIVIGTAQVVGAPTWNTVDGAKPAGDKAGRLPYGAMIYRPVAIAASEAARGATTGAVTGRWLGGQVGCDYGGVDIGTTLDVAAGSSYAFFVGPALEADGKLGSNLTIIEAWPVVGGMVRTPLEGGVSEATFMAMVNAAPLPPG